MFGLDARVLVFLVAGSGRERAARPSNEFVGWGLRSMLGLRLLSDGQHLAANQRICQVNALNAERNRCRNTENFVDQNFH